MILVTRYFFSVRTPFFRNQREGSESDNEQLYERIFHVARTTGGMLFWGAFHLINCDFTQFFAAPALIKLPQRFSFEHKVGNEKEEILRSLPPIKLPRVQKGGISLPRVVGGCSMTEAVFSPCLWNGRAR